MPECKDDELTININEIPIKSPVYVHETYELQLTDNTIEPLPTDVMVSSKYGDLLTDCGPY